MFKANEYNQWMILMFCSQIFPFHRKFKFPSVNGVDFPMHSHILVKSILHILSLGLFIGEEQECHRIIMTVIFLRLSFFKIFSSPFYPAILNGINASLLSVSWVCLQWFPKQQPYTGLGYLKCKSETQIRSDNKHLQQWRVPLLSMGLWMGWQVPM